MYKPLTVYKDGRSHRDITHLLANDHSEAQSLELLAYRKIPIFGLVVGAVGGE